jgi:hypothetical protein
VKEIVRPAGAFTPTAMRVYAVCRKCAEVHLADAGCLGCARRVVLSVAERADPRLAIGTRPLEPPQLRERAAPGAASAARPEPTAIAATPRPRWLRASTAVITVYLLAILALLAAALTEL